MQYKLSIITINYNNLTGLQKTIESVLSQTWKEFEYIVIDGGSNDGSIEYIQSKRNSFTFWTSEKDNGIYHAMNKGIEKATGEYILFINSGDTFFDQNVLEKVIPEIMLNKHVGVYYGDGIGIKQNNFSKTIYTPKEITLSQFYFSSVPHSAFSFIHKSLFFKFGKYNQELKYCSDWLLFLDMFLAGVTFQKLNSTNVGIFELDGLSSQEAARLERENLIASRPGLFEDSIELKKIRDDTLRRRCKRLLITLTKKF
jgi:glycosyltransferase involved in cell wall biosynthesis